MPYIYTIHPNAEAEAVETILSTEMRGVSQALRDRVNELSGRPGILSIPSVARSLRDRGAVYIAANRNSEWAKLHGQRAGFVVREGYICSFCRGGTRPIGNGARLAGDPSGPDTLPCPRCGSELSTPEAQEAHV